MQVALPIIHWHDALRWLVVRLRTFISHSSEYYGSNFTSIEEAVARRWNPLVMALSNDAYPTSDDFASRYFQRIARRKSSFCWQNMKTPSQEYDTILIVMKSHSALIFHRLSLLGLTFTDVFCRIIRRIWQRCPDHFPCRLWWNYIGDSFQMKRSANEYLTFHWSPYATVEAFTTREKWPLNQWQSASHQRLGKYRPGLVRHWRPHEAYFISYRFVAIEASTSKAPYSSVLMPETAKPISRNLTDIFEGTSMPRQSCRARKPWRNLE